MGAELAAELSRTVAAPVDRVFAAWVTPELLDRWFWPFPATYEVDLRVGGAFHFSSDVIGVSGRFLDVERPGRLAYTWTWDAEPGDTEVRVLFRSLGDSTEIVLTHSGNPDVVTRDNHLQGWNDCIARLGPSLE